MSALVNEFRVKGNRKSKWTPMDLRRSFALNFLLKGDDINRLQYILGYENVYDTKKMYGAVVTEKFKKPPLAPLKSGPL